MECEYKPLEDVISFDDFSYGDYYNGERDILQPRLEKLGYTNIRWGMGEYDSFGPLTRVCWATKDGTTTRFIYG